MNLFRKIHFLYCFNVRVLSSTRFLITSIINCSNEYKFANSQLWEKMKIEQMIKIWVQKDCEINANVSKVYI